MNNIIEFIDKISWTIISVSLDILGVISVLAILCLILFIPFIPIIVCYKPKKYYKIKSHNTGLNYTIIIKAKNKKQAQVKYYSDSWNKFDIIDSIEELEDE